MIGKHLQVRRVLLALLAIGGLTFVLLICFSWLPEVRWSARRARTDILVNAALVADEIEGFTAVHGRPPQTASEFQQLGAKFLWGKLTKAIVVTSREAVGRPMSCGIIPERGPILVISGDAARLEFYRSGAIGASRCLIPGDMREIRARQLVPLPDAGWQSAGFSWLLPDTDR